MNSFFPMPQKERIALFVLVAFAVLAFLPVFGRVSVLGVAVFGWLMALLLLGSPAILLLLLLGDSQPGDADPDRRPADSPQDP